ncbi:hypothetical protein BASA61_004716 [Batrachochytrium salamandrivorans]|nr:hypothetical protein BASA61_004716 [Batrachochytrium salamandrivorans]
MLSRLIITFLCAAAIGSVSGAFLTFDPDPVVLKDTDISTSVSVQLKSKPAEAVTVYFENPSIFMSTCVIVFDSNNWDTAQKISMAFTGDLEVQILRGGCAGKQSCFPAVVFRYGPTVMSMDTRGSAKALDRYSMTEVTPNTNGIRHTPGPEAGEHKIVFSMGEVAAFVNSWEVKDADVLTSPGARASIPPLQQQPGTVCKFPAKLLPKPVVPVPSTTTTTTTTTTTGTTTTGTTTAAATSTTATAPHSASTLPSTTSTASTIYPSPPAPSGYIPPPPPPPPPPDVIVEIQKCCQSIFNIPSCNAIVPAESYIQSCISDAKASGSYVSSDKVKQEYLAKCRTLTDDMILDPTKDVIDQGTKIKKECGFGNGTCINSCSGKGTCTDFGCVCSPGFSGMDCSMDLTKATQYDQSVNEYRINVNITVIQQQMEQQSKLPGSVPYATPDPYATPVPSVPSVPSVPYITPAPSVHSTPSVDQSLASFVGSLPKPSSVSPHIAEESQPPSPDSYDDFQKPIISSAISLGSLHMVSVAAVVITSYILLL